MRLTELEPQLVVHFERDGRQCARYVETLAEAHSIDFLCPTCFQRNKGPVGTHLVRVSFADRDIPDGHGSHGRSGKPSRWTVTGSSFQDLTLRPSIDLTPGCDWHGYITDGNVT